MSAPPRGFDQPEYAERLARAQSLMSGAGLQALLLTTEADLRYFTGFLTRFWESPTRPWFLVVPASGKPIAVIPSIGAALMSRTWIDDIRTWAAPDPADDGVSLLAETLREVTGGAARIGLPSGQESHLRMPLADYAHLSAMLEGRKLVPDAGLVAALRQIKSPQEIAKIRHACQIAGRAFARLDEIAGPGVPLSEVFRRFQMLCLQEGADWVPYLAGGAGPGGYDDVISPASDAPLADGDVLMLDTGLVWDGYFCDFDRNVAVSAASDETRAAHRRLIDAAQAGFEAARPGTRACDVFAAMRRVLPGGPEGTGAGRLGHGLGMQLTEGLSLIAADETELREGMVITLEPGIATPGGIMVHEEDIVITEAAPRYLSPPAQREIRVIG